MTQGRLFKRKDNGRYKPKLKHRDQVRSDHCEWKRHECRFDVGDDGETVIRVPTGVIKDCKHRAFQYRVNHVVIGLCRCCAARMAKKKGVRVVALRG
jgi:hypothetical protein